MSHPRRQQLTRLMRAASRGLAAVLAGTAALAAIGAGKQTFGVVLALAAGLLALAARHEWRQAERSRVGARSEAAVRRVLEPLAGEGWRVRHAVDWPPGGDLDHVRRAPAGVGFVIETKTLRYGPAQLERTARAAHRLARRRGRYPGGVLPVLCVARARGLERVERGVLVVSLERIVPALRCHVAMVAGAGERAA